MRLYRTKRSPFWWVDLRGRGLGRHSTQRTDRKEAEVEGARLLVELSSRTPASTEAAATILALHGAWAASLPPGRQGREDAMRAGDFVHQYGEKKQARSVRAADVSRWARSLVETRAPATAVRYRASLAAMFKWAVQLGYVDTNPVRDSWCPKTGSRQKRAALSEEAVRETLDRVRGSPLEAAYHLAFLAGLRRAEITSARFDHVDFARGTILVRGSKTEGSTATLPLHPELRSFLESIGRKSGPIVARKDGRAYHPASLEKLRQEIPGLPGFHLGRHTLACLLVRGGADIYMVSQLLRHTSVKTTESYYAWAAPAARGAEFAKFRILPPAAGPRPASGSDARAMQDAIATLHLPVRHAAEG